MRVMPEHEQKVVGVELEVSYDVAVAGVKVGYCLLVFPLQD